MSIMAHYMAMVLWCRLKTIQVDWSFRVLGSLSGLEKNSHMSCLCGGLEWRLEWGWPSANVQEEAEALSHVWKEMNFVNKETELGGGVFPRQESRQEWGPSDTVTQLCETLSSRPWAQPLTQLCQDPSHGNFKVFSVLLKGTVCGHSLSSNRKLIVQSKYFPLSLSFLIYVVGMTVPTYT